MDEGGNSFHGSPVSSTAQRQAAAISCHFLITIVSENEAH